MNDGGEYNQINSLVEQTVSCIPENHLRCNANVVVRGNFIRALCEFRILISSSGGAGRMVLQRGFCQLFSETDGRLAMMGFQKN